MKTKTVLVVDDEADIVELVSYNLNKEGFSVDSATDGETAPLTLSSTEFRLLLYLAERRGKVFSRGQLLDAIWKDESFVEPRTVDVHIRRLRTQIEDEPSDPKYIMTRRGIGYYLEADI